MCVLREFIRALECIQTCFSCVIYRLKQQQITHTFVFVTVQSINQPSVYVQNSDSLQHFYCCYN